MCVLPGSNALLLSNNVNVMTQKYRQGINFPILPLNKANPLIFATN